MLRRISTYALILLTLAIPFEHKYDKLFRHFSNTLIPIGIDLPSFFDKKIYFYASDLIALAFGIAALAAFRVPLRRFFASRSAPYLWIVFLLAILSIALSPLAHYPIPYVRLLQLLTPILLFCYLANFTDNPMERPKITNSILTALVAAALIQSIIAIVQYDHQSALGLRLIGENNSFSSIHVPDGKKWIFDASSASSPAIIRASGTLPHANVLGGFLCASILASYSLFFYSPRFRNWLALFLPIQFFAMCLTYSRSAIFAWILATLFWFGHHLVHRGFKAALGDRTTRLLSLAIFASICMSTFILHEQFRYRGGIVNYEGTGAQKGDALRLYYQNVALRLIEKYPLCGTGFHQLSLRAVELISPKENTQDPSIGTHNIYLYLAAELGLPALLAFLCFIGSLLWAALKAQFTPHLSSLMAIIFAFLFIGCCDFYPLLFQQGKLLFFLAAGLLAANLPTTRHA